MTVYDSAHSLARAIRESDEATECKRLRTAAEADDTNRALLAEYKRLQMALQIQAMGGSAVPEEEMRRFSQIGSLLYLNGDVQAYLMAEMRLQKLIADVFKIISEAGGINMDMLGV